VAKRCVIGLWLLLNANRKLYHRNSLILSSKPSVSPNLGSRPHSWNCPFISETNWCTKFKCRMAWCRQVLGHRIKIWLLMCPGVAWRSDWGKFCGITVGFCWSRKVKGHEVNNLWNAKFTLARDQNVPKRFIDSEIPGSIPFCVMHWICCWFYHQILLTALNPLSSSSFLACNSRLCSAIRRHHPPQRAVLSQICCFGERKMVMFQILLDGAEPCDARTTQLSSPVCRRGGQQDPLGICVVVHAHNMPK